MVESPSWLARFFILDENLVKTVKSLGGQFIDTIHDKCLGLNIKEGRISLE